MIVAKYLQLIGWLHFYTQAVNMMFTTFSIYLKDEKICLDIIYEVRKDLCKS